MKKEKNSNMRKWTVDMNAPCIYGTAGFEVIKDKEESKNLILLLITRAQLFDNMEIMELSPNQKIVKLWDKNDALLISSLKRNGKNEIIFIATDLKSVDFTWEEMKKMAMEIKGH